MLQWFRGDDLLTRYFCAWRAHDEDAILRLFTPDATYHVLNKRRVYRGLGDISSYWKRNSCRQKSLHVTWYTILRSRWVRVCWFRADFIDTEEREHNLVRGLMCLEGCSRVKRLSEFYIKSTDGAEETC
ncbi:nuclear transport factor 2 family protein [Azospirillum brasilense]